MQDLEEGEAYVARRSNSGKSRKYHTKKACRYVSELMTIRDIEEAKAWGHEKCTQCKRIEEGTAVV